MNIDELTIEELQAQQQIKVAEARKINNQITEKMSASEARAKEREFDVLMAEHDDLAFEIEKRKAEEWIDPSALRGDDGEARGVDDGQHDKRDYKEVEAVGLKPEQRFADWAKREYRKTEFANLQLGDYFRAMVLGAKTDLEKRALAEGTDSAGGYTVPTILSSELIDLMRANSVAVKAGARTVPLRSDQNVIAKLASDPVPAWRNENAAIAESDPTFSAITLAPKSLAVLIKVSRELLEDSLNLSTELPRIMSVAMAKEWDRVALLGSGTAPEPEGVANVTGIGTNALSGALTNYAPFITARTAIKTANAQPSAIIMHPRDEGTLAGLTASDNQPLMAPRQIADLPWLTTTAIPVDGGAGSDESTIFMGDFSRLYLGVRTELRITMHKDVFAANGQYAFIAWMRGDIAVTHPGAFHTTTAVQG